MQLLGRHVWWSQQLGDSLWVLGTLLPLLLIVSKPLGDIACDVHVATVHKGKNCWLPHSLGPSRAGFGQKTPGDVSVDVPVLAEAHRRGKVHMMGDYWLTFVRKIYLRWYNLGLSLVQYKNSYGVNVYRGEHLNLPIRMENILGMKDQPKFVMIQTWVGSHMSELSLLWSRG